MNETVRTTIVLEWNKTNDHDSEELTKQMAQVIPNGLLIRPMSLQEITVDVLDEDGEITDTQTTMYNYD